MDFSDTAAFEGLLARTRAAIQDVVPTDELTREMQEAFAAERLPWPEGRLGPESRGGPGAAASTRRRTSRPRRCSTTGARSTARSCA